jgi:hypothetical protein
MPQDQTTGAAADAFGRKTAPLIAQAIGATMRGGNSNEAEFNNQRVVIKCAGQKTQSVGVTYLMLERLDAIIAAFERSDDAFDVIALPAEVYRRHMTETQSRGASAGAVGIVRKSVFVAQGIAIATTRI